MNQSRLYSVRMRASENESHENGGRHISGGELLSSYNELGLKRCGGTAHLFFYSTK